MITQYNRHVRNQNWSEVNSVLAGKGKWKSTPTDMETQHTFLTMLKFFFTNKKKVYTVYMNVIFNKNVTMALPER